jgi:hypothetical protein
MAGDPLQAVDVALDKMLIEMSHLLTLKAWRAACDYPGSGGRGAIDQGHFARKCDSCGAPPLSVAHELSQLG